MAYGQDNNITRPLLKSTGKPVVSSLACITHNAGPIFTSRPKDPDEIVIILS